VAAYDEERWRLQLLSALETTALSGLAGFAWCRYQAARAAYNHGTHDNFHQWLATHALETKVAATFEPFFVASSAAALMAATCGGGAHASAALRFCRGVLAHALWFPVATLSFTAYLMSGAAICFIKARPQLAADGGFLGRVFCLVLFSLVLGFALSLVVERPAMRFSRLVLAFLASS